MEADEAVASSDFLVFKEDRERKKKGGEEGLKADFRLSIMGTWSNRSIEKSAPSISPPHFNL